jgi:probable phosphoglycerate mutase
VARSTTTPAAGRRRSSAAQADHPRPTVILLVRHGKTPTTGQVLPGRAAGLHLSEEGQAQADDAARRIAELGAGQGTAPTAVYASPLERTTETARPIARALGLRVRSERGLLECDFGEWTGAKLSVLAKRPEWATVQRNPSGFRFPGGESFLEMQTRMTQTLAGLAARHPGETVVAVSHADPIKAVIAQAAGTPLDLFQRLTVAPCSISALAYTSGGPFVLTVNSTASLQALAIA